MEQVSRLEDALLHTESLSDATTAGGTSLTQRLGITYEPVKRYT
jgi:hypothetical protein